jgi:hypothetical protein
MEHTHGHLWHRYSITFNHITVVDFNFPIVNFLFICSNIPAASTYVVYISQLIRYSRTCGVYQDCLGRSILCRIFSFFIAPHCQVRGVGHGIKQTYLYMWYPLFQAQFWWTCFSMRQSSYLSEKLWSSYRRRLLLFAWGRIHSDASKEKQRKLSRFFKFIFRFIDDREHFGRIRVFFYKIKSVPS